MCYDNTMYTTSIQQFTPHIFFHNFSLRALTREYKSTRDMIRFSAARVKVDHGIDNFSLAPVITTPPLMIVNNRYNTTL